MPCMQVTDVTLARVTALQAVDKNVFITNLLRYVICTTMNFRGCDSFMNETFFLLNVFYC